MKYLLLIPILCCFFTIRLSMSNNDLCFALPSFLTEWNITVKVNTSFKIKIEGNPTTGYIWYIGNVNEIKQQFLVMKNINSNNSTDNYIVDKNNDGIVGQPGYYLFEFEAIKTTLLYKPIKMIFNQKRPWEETPIESVNTFITIIN